MEKKKEPVGLSLMNNNRILIVIFIILNLIAVGAVSASGYYGSTCSRE